MDRNIRDRYLLWMRSLIFFDGVCDHTALMMALDDIPFRYVLEMDGNREMDGIALRYRFGYENGISGDDISDAMGNKPCSVLEMMTALCLRYAEQFIDDDISSHIRNMFCDMLTSLGLFNQTDDHIDISEVKRIIGRFLDRKYCSDGKGGLFTVSCTERDMRKVEIWYQMCLYLDERMEI